MARAGLVLWGAWMLAAAPASAQTKNTFRICSPANSIPISFAYASKNRDLATIAVYGWFRVDPGRCSNTMIWTADNYTHHFVFSRRGGGLLSVSPQEYDLMGFKTTFGLRLSNESFCVNRSDGFEIIETIFSQGRAKRCRPTEDLAKFSLQVEGGYRDYTLNLPAFSEKKKPLLSRLFGG